MKAKFKDHFIKCHNKIYKRTKFNQWKQLAGESVNDGLVVHCELQQEIRNHIVVGLQDTTLAEKQVDIF